MKHVKSDPVDKTIRLWRHRTRGPVSPEDAKEMINNIAGFFQVLSDWSCKIHNEDAQAEALISSHADRRMRGGKRTR